MIDKETGMSKGSAFVKFFNAEDAQRCVEAFQVSRGSVLIKDRECRADLAVDKGRLQQIKSERDMKTKRPNDKRNLFLANEGLVLEESTKLANPIDQEKRKKAQTDKRRKLTNPLFFVSAHRVSIRNLPKTMGDFDLKIMCLKAAKAGLAHNLVTSKDIDAYSVAQGVSSSSSISSESTPSFSKTAIASAKVMLDLDKVK